MHEIKFREIFHILAMLFDLQHVIDMLNFDWKLIFSRSVYDRIQFPIIFPIINNTNGGRKFLYVYMTLSFAANPWVVYSLSPFELFLTGLGFVTTDEFIIMSYM